MTTSTPLPPGAIVATVASAAMIAQQVAGKAARDALFLSNFHVTSLPGMMAAAAVLSLGAVLYLSRMIVRNSPARVVPLLFGISAAGLLLEWALSFPAPRITAVLVYFHTALFGAAVISAFWSLINEKFDPHSGKRAAAWIAAGGTLGGMLGSVIAWRAATFIAVPTMLPILAALNVLCVWATIRLGGEAKELGDVEAHGAPDEPSPLQVLRGAPYLRNLAAIVMLGAVTSGLLDYVFSDEATKVYTKGPALLSYFALFWLVIGVLSFLLQLALGRVALEKLGLAVTVALLPGVVVLGGAFGLAVPGLLSTAILRGGEAVQRNSLFRAAYELLYTPLSEQKKRATKTLIDVGFDRVGTVAASGLAAVAIWIVPSRAGGVLLVVAIASALITLARSRALHTGYVDVLQESLRQEAKERAPFSLPDRGPQATPEVRDAIVERLDALPASRELAALAGANGKIAPPPSQGRLRAKDARQAVDDAVRRVTELGSPDPERVRKILGSDEPLTASQAALAILLLADPGIHLEATRALRKVAGKITGQLADALCDPGLAFEIRRRIPRVLTATPTQAAAQALLRGAEDDRFEVRYECGRALLAMTEKEGPIVVPLERIVALVQREAALSKEVWESQQEQEFDEEEAGAPTLIDRLLRDRKDRSLEHVFTLLAVPLDRTSLRIAFKALHDEDPHFRGTALEYLETVLPDDVRDVVWPFLGEERPLRPARKATEILADLKRQRDTLLIPAPRGPLNAVDQPT